MTTQPKLQIAVLDRGFVYVGLCARTDSGITITHASCVRRWGTRGEGIGKLALHGPQGETKLDFTGTLHAPAAAVIHLIDCDPAHWPAFAA